MTRVPKAWLALAVTLATSIPAFAFTWSDGKEAYDKGDYLRAIFFWTDNSVAKDASNVNDPRYYFWLASAYSKIGANDKAAETARSGLALSPQDSNVVGNLQWILGSAELSLGQPGQALVAAQAAIAAQPQDVMNYKLLADVQFALERYDDAITAARRAIEIKPVPVAYYTLAACYLQKGDLDAGLVEVRKGLELAPQNPLLLDALGFLSIRNSSFADAASAFAKEFELTKSAGAQRWLALSRYMQGRYDDAAAVAGAMIEDGEQGRLGFVLSETPRPFKVASVQPNSPAEKAGLQAGDWIYEIDGTKIAKSHMNGTTSALCSLDAAVALLRGRPGTTVQIKLARQAKMLPIKVTLVRAALELGRAAEGYAVQSLCARAKGDLDRAATLAEQAAGLATDASWARTARGFALLEAGRADEALAVFQSNADRAEIPFRQVGRALCLARKGSLDKAAEIYASRHDWYDPRDVPLEREKVALATVLAPVRQGHLDGARALEAEGKYAESLGEYTSALLLAKDEEDAAAIRGALLAAAAKLPTPPELPEEARRHVVRGELLIKEGDFRAALPEFMAALRLAPYVPKLYYNAALLNGELKRYGEAMRLMKIYVQTAPDAPDNRAARDEIITWELLLERQGKS